MVIKGKKIFLVTLAVLFTHHGLGECLNGAANNSALSDNVWPNSPSS